MKMNNTLRTILVFSLIASAIVLLFAIPVDNHPHYYRVLFLTKIGFVMCVGLLRLLIPKIEEN